MTQTEEPLQNIEYVRCPTCFGARCNPSGIWRCKTCDGWGFMASPTKPEEQIALYLRALRPSSSIELTPPPKKRLRLPLRKRRKT